MLVIGLEQAECIGALAGRGLGICGSFLRKEFASSAATALARIRPIEDGVVFGSGAFLRLPVLQEHQHRLAL